MFHRIFIEMEIVACSNKANEKLQLKEIVNFKLKSLKSKSFNKKTIISKFS